MGGAACGGVPRPPNGTGGGAGLMGAAYVLTPGETGVAKESLPVAGVPAPWVAAVWATADPAIRPNPAMEIKRHFRIDFVSSSRQRVGQRRGASKRQSAV